MVVAVADGARDGRDGHGQVSVLFVITLKPRVESYTKSMSLKLPEGVVVAVADGARNGRDGHGQVPHLLGELDIVLLYG